jgi:hypothetical protein
MRVDACTVKGEADIGCKWCRVRCLRHMLPHMSLSAAQQTAVSAAALASLVGGCTAEATRACMLLVWVRVLLVWDFVQAAPDVLSGG